MPKSKVKDKNKINKTTEKPEKNSEVWEIWKKIASSITKIPEGDISLDTNYNIETEPENPQTTGASISINTLLIKKAAEALNRKLLSDSPFPVTIKKTFSVNPKRNWNIQTFSGYPFVTTSFAAMILELELDMATYTPQLRGIWFIVDAGKILNPHAAETALKNSIQEELRELIEDDEIESPEISIQFIQSNDEAKQLGDIASSLLPAAYSSALSQAVGKTITNMPVQTDTVYKFTSELQKLWNETHSQTQTGEEEKA